MSVINRQGPEIVDENIEDVEFESQQLLKDIEKEFETLKMQDDHFEQDELIDDFSPEGEEEIEVKKSEWIWNLVAVIVFALIGVGAERAYTILSNKQVDLPEHLESLQEEEENLFADDSSNSEKAFHLRKALNAQNDYDREAVADLMDQEQLKSFMKQTKIAMLIPQLLILILRKNLELKLLLVIKNLQSKNQTSHQYLMWTSKS